MNKDAFKTLREVAAYSFSNPYAGLRTMLRADNQFAKYVEKNYRIKKFNEEHNFFMTRNEIDFHLIGFMDAILWLSRSNMLRNSDDKTADDDDIDFELSEEELESIKRSEMEKKAVWSYIISYETGEDGWQY